jgi:S1-C subfamily serine protease
VFLPTRNYGWIKRLRGPDAVTEKTAGAEYHQFAYYLAKRKHINSFGVYFLFPASARDSRIHVGVVVPGSPAAKQGIRPGDRVVSINGRRVFGSEDVMPFAVNTEEIVRMETVHE